MYVVITLVIFVTANSKVWAEATYPNNCHN